jgi:MFS family permease
MNRSSSSGAFAPPLLALYLVSMLAGAASGLFNPLIATLMTQRGASEVMVGANSTVFFLCIMLAVPFARGRSVRTALAVGLSLTALSAVQFPFYDASAAWFALRAVMGFGVGLYMVASQTALNASVDDDKRATVGGLYALAFGIGLGLGPVVGAGLYAWQPAAAFGLGALLLALGLPIAWPWLSPSPLRSERLRLALVGTLSLPLHAVFAYGVAEASLMSLYPVYAAARGLTVVEMSLGFSAFVAGGILATLPVSHLADRLGRERVLMVCATFGAIAMIAMMLVEGAAATAVASFSVGAALGPVFTLALALIGQRLGRDELASGSALFTASFGFGSMVGPLLVALAMRYLGHSHLFTLSILLFATLAMRIVLHRARLSAARV